MAVKRAVDKKLIRQTKGIGFGGSFRVAAGGGGGGAAKATVGSMDDLLPVVFTWVCNPKEASFAYIRYFYLFIC
jgi:hypothetical protein